MTRHRASPALDPVAWAHVNTAAIAQNLAWLRSRLHGAVAEPAHPPRLWAVVKADAYGHGLAHVLQALHDADGICVGNLHEAHTARHHGWRGPVLVLSVWGVRPNDLCDPALGELHVVVDDDATLHLLEALPPGRPAPFAWLRHAGCLHSLGFADAEYARAHERLHACAQAGVLAGVGHLLHYASAEDPEALAGERAAFLAATAGLPGPRCTGNSAALCGSPHTVAGDDWARCGLALYGASALPGVTGPELGLQPAMSLHARLVAVQTVRAGEPVGYGGSYRAPHDTRIGVAGVGYGHGIPRNLWQRGMALVGRPCRRVPLAGRVTMDCLTIDLGPHATEGAGDIVTLWGHGADSACLPVEHAAAACDTIAADLLTGLTARMPLMAS